MPNLKFDFSRRVRAANQCLIRAPPLGGAPSPCGLMYLSTAARGDIGARRLPPRRQPLSNILLEMTILPFFHDNFPLPLYFFNNRRLHLHPCYNYFDKLYYD